MRDNLTPDQQICADVLAEVFGGYHHLPRIHENGTGIAVNVHADLTTHDGNKLTELVLAAHKYAVRIGVESSGPGLVKITAYKRQHGDKRSLKFWEYHPDLKDLSDACLRSQP